MAMQIRSISWHKNTIRIIDQTKLPLELEYLSIDTIQELWQAIRVLKVRGAPALGAASALGMYLGVRNVRTDNFAVFKKAFEKAAAFLASSRPTAKNLFWGIERMRAVVGQVQHQSVSVIKKMLLKEAESIIEEDRRSCRAIGRHGASLIRDRDRILTVCNAGILATIDYGTALGVIYRAQEEGKRVSVFSCETRPLLQGARLTTWELRKKGVPVTLICDNMAATLMHQGKIDKVIAGADRIASNGDTANKIGTYSLAVLAKHHTIPFYIAAPASTFDLSIAGGKQIPIEERDGKEVTELFYARPITQPHVAVYNPAFDVTPHGLITAIITDKGIIRPPFRKNIAKAIRA
jgi:methylthioribose-1-phosphate isomerase